MNDRGKWIGWNGGECPVHPKTEVEVIIGDCPLRHKKGLARCFGWSDKEHPIIVYRVVKEYKEPREFWIRENSYGVVFVDRSSVYGGTHFREVVD